MDGAEPLFWGFILGPPIVWTVVLGAAWIWRGVRPQTSSIRTWLIFSGVWLGLFLGIPLVMRLQG